MTRAPRPTCHRPESSPLHARGLLAAFPRGCFCRESRREIERKRGACAKPCPFPTQGSAATPCSSGPTSATVGAKGGVFEVWLICSRHPGCGRVCVGTRPGLAAPDGCTPPSPPQNRLKNRQRCASPSGCQSLPAARRTSRWTGAPGPDRGGLALALGKGGGVWGGWSREGCIEYGCIGHGWRGRTHPPA